MSQSGLRTLALMMLLLGTAAGIVVGLRVSRVQRASSGNVVAGGPMLSPMPWVPEPGVVEQEPLPESDGASAEADTESVESAPQPEAGPRRVLRLYEGPPTAGATPLPSLADLVDSCAPAVVAIGLQVRRSEVAQLRQRMGPREGLPDEDAAPPDPLRPDRIFVALGTGFVVDPSGGIVTNRHVAAEARQMAKDIGAVVAVRTHGGSVCTASIAGMDEETDLAALWISPPEPLPALVWGDSDQLRIGDWVLAIGNPFGLESSVTVGIISARGRQLSAIPGARAHTYDDYLQTDAAINPGNSGGPLLAMDGRVVGINTAIQTDTPISSRAGSIGIGFAIPSNLASTVVQALFRDGKVVRGYIGVTLPAGEAERGRSTPIEGALLLGVQEGGPADAAGLREGDVIVELDGRPITRSKDLIEAVAWYPVGTRVDVTYLRDGKRLTARVEVTQRPSVSDLERALEQERRRWGE